MKPALIAFGLASSLLLLPGVAVAADDDDASAGGGTTAVPPPRTGFQMALRSGYMIPFGQATGVPGADMTNIFSGQVPLILDIGSKLSESFFLGGYVGLGFGGAAGTLGNLCNRVQASCVTASFRLGIEALVYLSPDAATNPWVGYGIGLESTGFNATAGGETVQFAAAGWEFGHLMAGVDFRMSKSVGFGPVVDLSFGQYNHATIQSPGVPQQDGTIANQAMHEWLLVGARVVFFP
jgi:hypothetical protein